MSVRLMYRRVGPASGSIVVGSFERHNIAWKGVEELCDKNIKLNSVLTPLEESNGREYMHFTDNKSNDVLYMKD